MNSKGEKVKVAAREHRNDPQVLKPLLDKFYESQRSLANKFHISKALEDSEPLSGPGSLTEGREMSDKAAQQESADDPKK